MQPYLSQLFLKLEDHFQNGNYICQPVNQKKFKEFTFDKAQLDEYVCNTLIYKWFVDHKDHRCKDFTYILKPDKKVQVDMKNVSFEELLNFISPQTKKTR